MLLCIITPLTFTGCYSVFDRGLLWTQATTQQVENLVGEAVSAASADLRQMISTELGRAGVSMSQKMEKPLSKLRSLYDDMKESLEAQVGRVVGRVVVRRVVVRRVAGKELSR